jgi:DNA repair protein RadD
VELRDYQRDAVSRTLSWLAVRRCNPLIVIPPGGGKSLVIADLVRSIIEMNPEARVLVPTHRRELVQQDAAELKAHVPGIDMGVCSASLGSYEIRNQVVLGTVQTLANRQLGYRGVTHIIVDEAHLISRQSRTRYQTLFDSVSAANKNRKTPIIGLTATPYRLDSGMLHRGKDAMFDVISATVPVNHLIRSKWLVPLINQPGIEIDTTGIKRDHTGDYVKELLEREVFRQHVTARALDEAVRFGKTRKRWLIFGVSIQHCEAIANYLYDAHDVQCVAMTSSLRRSEREEAIERFIAGDLRCLASVDIMSTGLNVRGIDMIQLLRPTLSTGLYVQMLGRGLRTCEEEGKQDCLILDNGGNIARHGPFNDPHVHRFDRIYTSGEARPNLKMCPDCGTEMNSFQRACRQCGHLFSRVNQSADIANSVLDMARADPVPQKRPGDIIRDYLNRHKVSHDPFIDHLMDLRDSE